MPIPLPPIRSTGIESAFTDLDLTTEEGVQRATERLITLTVEGALPLDKAEFVRKCLDDLRVKKPSGGALAEGLLEMLMAPRERPKPRYVLEVKEGASPTKNKEEE